MSEQPDAKPPASSENDALDVGVATLSRRQVTGLISTFTAGLVGGGFALWGTQETLKVFKEAEDRKQKEKKARALFTELFGDPGKVRDCYDGSHPDNRVADEALRYVFGMHDRPPTIDDGRNRQLGVDGDLIAYGGPNSTLLTALAWEFTGPDKSRLTRDADPCISLRISGLSNKDDDRLHGYRLKYTRADLTTWPTIAWPLVDTHGPPLIPQPTGRPLEQVRHPHNGTMIDVYQPLDNYLLITRLPNYISKKRKGGPDFWDKIVAMEGNNGIGTRGAELLLSDAGYEVLKQVKEATKQATAFQAAFRLTNLETTRRGQRFTQIELVRVYTLDIPANKYEQAHVKAWERLPKLRPHYVVTRRP